MSTAAKMKRRAGKPKVRMTEEDREWSSMKKIAGKVEAGWQYFWKKRGMEPPPTLRRKY